MWYEVHPAIGIARLGSTAETADECYFFGPEPRCSDQSYMDPQFEYRRTDGRARYQVDGSEVANYRLENGELRRQAVRFRVFECDDSTGTLLRREIDHSKLAIEWTIHLANRKGVAYAFADHNKAPGEKRRRNHGAQIKDVVIHQRRTLSAESEAAVPQGVPVQGQFMGVDVELAHLKTDSKGRLLVIGPQGQSASASAMNPDTFADNDGWYDNTADGPVLAKLYHRTTDGLKPVTEQVRGAWAIVAPFDFAPEVDSFVTLYDVAQQAWHDRAKRSPPSDTFYASDILPVLQRVRGYRWVSGPAIRAETQDRHKAWRDAESPLGNPNHAEGAAYRAMLFSHIASPDENNAGKRQVLMPRLHADEPYRVQPDGTPDAKASANAVLTLTPIQYAHFARWAANDFDPGARRSREDLADALDRIALEACSGGAFYPGMEAPRLMQDSAIYDPTAFRLKARLNDGVPVDPSSEGPEAPIADGLLPGQLTEGLAVPWQADFWACQMERDNAWWPASRPDHVFLKQPSRPIDSQSEEVYRWDDGLPDFQSMVDKWKYLGVITRKQFEPNDNQDPQTDKDHDPRVIADHEGTKNYYFYEAERVVAELPHDTPSSGERPGGDRHQPG
jgi:hypothetical protein